MKNTKSDDNESRWEESRMERRGKEGREGERLKEFMGMHRNT